MRYEATLGPNTKQWWAFDNETGELCDPPTEILEQIEAHSEDIDEQREFFDSILETEPEWLNDEDYRYDGEEFEI